MRKGLFDALITRFDRTTYMMVTCHSEIVFILDDMAWLTSLLVHGCPLTGETFANYSDMYELVFGDGLSWTEGKKTTILDIIHFSWAHLPYTTIEERDYEKARL